MAQRCLAGGVVALVLLVSSCDVIERGVGRRAQQPVGKHPVSCKDLRRYVQRTRLGYVPGRSADLLPVPHEPNYQGSPENPVHTGPFDFLAEVPLIMYGPGHIRSEARVESAATMADVAPTIAKLIGFDDYRAPDGKPLLTGAGSKPPRLVVTLVWDGGGWNTLRQHPDRWPFLERLATKGLSVGRMTIGSTPSVTPPIHTTLGTGAFPNVHGIPHVRMTTRAGDYVDPFEGNSPRLIEVSTLADEYDAARDNTPLIGVVATVSWHLGMIGHGALFDGGDRDLAVLLNSSGSVYGDPRVYEIPNDLSAPQSLIDNAATLDRSDGDADGEWRGHDLENLSIRYASPASVGFQQTVLERTISTRGFGDDDTPDLLFSNFKSIDDAGHHWGMTSQEMGDVVAATDDALKRLVAFLDREIGRRRWIILVTSDHGFALYPEESGAWAIRGRDLEEDINREFGVAGEPVVERVTSAGIFLNEDQRDRIDPVSIGEWLLDYTARDNLFQLDDIPAYYEEKADVPLFDAVLEGTKVVAQSCRP